MYTNLLIHYNTAPCGKEMTYSSDYIVEVNTPGESEAGLSNEEEPGFKPESDLDDVRVTVAISNTSTVIDSVYLEEGQTQGVRKYRVKVYGADDNPAVCLIHMYSD